MKRGRCLFPGCHEFTHARGLCKNHYRTARQRLQMGKASEEDLIERRLILPKKKPGRASISPFDIGQDVRGDS